jgi:hypothetical protein
VQFKGQSAPIADPCRTRVGRSNAAAGAAMKGEWPRRWGMCTCGRRPGGRTIGGTRQHGRRAECAGPGDRCAPAGVAKGHRAFWPVLRGGHHDAARESGAQVSRAPHRCNSVTDVDRRTASMLQGSNNKRYVPKLGAYDMCNVR